MATRPVLRIFISSTAVDLRDYRDKVRDAIQGLENLPVQMETFSAKSGEPANECMRMAAEADAVICIVAHRYGYVPPPKLGEKLTASTSAASPTSASASRNSPASASPPPSNFASSSATAASTKPAALSISAANNSPPQSNHHPARESRCAVLPSARNAH